LHACPLCSAHQIESFTTDKQRQYLLCVNCWLVFVPESDQLSRDQERAIYDHHCNDINDEGYRRFLSRLHQPMSARLLPNSLGLDFGCGPGPLLAEMFKADGHKVYLYDKFYQPTIENLSRSYDFIVASEVVEHLQAPGIILDNLWHNLTVGGWLGIMSKRWLSLEKFATWHYKRDPTHICFFHLKTFEWLAQRWSTSMEVCSSDVVIFRKPVN